MKKSLITATVLFQLFYLSSEAQWNIEPGTTNLFTITDMHFTNLNTGFAVGTNQIPNGNAIIVKTTNGGSSWSAVFNMPPVNTPSTLILNHINFVSPTVAFATGGYFDANKAVICKTTNGGNTWDTISHNLPTSKVTYTHFFNVNEGICTSYDLYKTTDGGITWNIIPSPVGSDGLFRVVFTTSDTGYAIGFHDNLLIQSVDHGATWNSIPLPTTEETEAIYFVNSLVGFIGCENGVILKTTDGGNNWSQVVNNDADNGDVQCFEFVTPQVGFAGTFSGLILKTTDGGATWNENYDVTTYPGLFLAGINCIKFGDANVGYAGTDFTKIAKTTNAGGGTTFISEYDNNESMLFYPNPVNDFIYFNPLALTEGKVTVSLKTMEGRLIKECHLPENDLRLDVREVIPGVYFVELITREGVKSQRLLKL